MLDSICTSQIALFPESQRRAANTHIDLAFTRQVAKRKAGGGKDVKEGSRCIDMDGFCHAIVEIAVLRFPEFGGTDNPGGGEAQCREAKS